jgi:hypothetical protein
MLSTSQQKQRRADSVFKMLTRQSNIPKLSKSPPMIELSKLLNGEIKLSEDNPKLRLSIEDYNLMCEDDNIKEIIGKVLNIDIDSLTAFCEDVKVLENYVDLSQSTIKEKKIAKRLPIIKLLTDLPVELIQTITNKFGSLLEFKLVEWINVSEILKCAELSSNKNAIELLSKPENIKYINYKNLSKNINPEAFLLIKNKIIQEKKLSKTQYEKLDDKISWYDLSENPIAVEILELDIYKNDISWEAICNNTNPKVLKLIEKKIKEDPDELDWEELSSNPIAIKLLKKYSNDIDYSGLSANSSDEAIQLLQKKPKEIDLAMLSANTNPKALKLLKKLLEKNPEKLKDWTNLSKNPLPEAIQILKDNFTKIEWGWLSYNSSDEAIQLLKDNRNKISWNMLSANTNPKALELLKEERMVNPEKIYWPYLSANPSIFTIG